MDTKRILIGTLVGGLAMYVLGYLIFELALGRFYATNVEGTLQWAIALGTLSLAALVTRVIESRGGTLTIGKGFTTGAIVGFLVWFGVDFIGYGLTNVPSLTGAIVDPLLQFVRTGVGGAIIAAVLTGMAKPELRAQART